ncbi:MAG: hypothetical protein AAF596_04840 [Planctomycetota bacterium]
MPTTNSRDEFDSNEFGGQDDGSSEFVAAARVSNLAEAGYLVSVLQGEGLDARVRQSRDFNAVNGAWLTDYVVQAPKDQLAEVATVLRAEAAAFDEEAVFDDEDDESLQQVIWRPVALMAVAGVVSFLAGQHLATPQPRSGPPALAEAIGSIGRPLYTERGPDGVRHRLVLDGRSSQWLLDTDADGDGRYDRRQRFPAESAMAAPRR